MNYLVKSPVITFSITERGHISVTRMPHPDFKHQWVKKAFQLVMQKTPAVTLALLRERALGQLERYPVELIILGKGLTADSSKKQLAHWLKRHRTLRLIYLVLEGLLLPLTPVLALLPGPNIFFYVPALLFYFHLASFRGLKQSIVDEVMRKCIVTAKADL